MDEVDITDFSNALLSIKKDIHICPSCGNMTEDSLCSICQDNTRNHRQVLVVETIKYAFLLIGINISLIINSATLYK